MSRPVSPAPCLLPRRRSWAPSAGPRPANWGCQPGLGLPAGLPYSVGAGRAPLPAAVLPRPGQPPSTVHAGWRNGGPCGPQGLQCEQGGSDCPPSPRARPPALGRRRHHSHLEPPCQGQSQEPTEAPALGTGSRRDPQGRVRPGFQTSVLHSHAAVPSAADTAPATTGSPRSRETGSSDLSAVGNRLRGPAAPRGGSSTAAGTLRWEGRHAAARKRDAGTAGPTSHGKTVPSGEHPGNTCAAKQTTCPAGAAQG